jgi:hypothetical protein
MAKVQNVPNMSFDEANSSDKRRPSLQQDLSIYALLRMKYQNLICEPLHSVRDAIVDRFGPGVFFGLLDHRRKSFSSSISEGLLYVFYRLSQIGLILLIYYAMKEWQFMIRWLDDPSQMHIDIKKDWWQWVGKVQLFLCIFLPAYKNARKQRQYFQEKGSFSQRVVVSLNCLVDVPARDVNGEVSRCIWSCTTVNWLSE